MNAMAGNAWTILCDPARFNDSSAAYAALGWCPATHTRDRICRVLACQWAEYDG